MEKVLSNDRICSRHYVSGKPAALEDHANPDWLLFSEFLVSTINSIIIVESLLLGLEVRLELYVS